MAKTAEVASLVTFMVVMILMPLCSIESDVRGEGVEATANDK